MARDSIAGRIQSQRQPKTHAPELSELSPIRCVETRFHRAHRCSGVSGGGGGTARSQARAMIPQADRRDGVSCFITEVADRSGIEREVVGEGRITAQPHRREQAQEMTT